MGAPPKHRENLLINAITLFRRQGFSGTGIAEILSASGAPKGSLYHYFPNGKDQIAAEALDLVRETVAGKLRDAARHAANANELVRQFSAALQEGLHHSEYREGCPVAAIIVDAASSTPELCQAGSKIYQEWGGIIASKIESDGVPHDRAQTLGLFVVSTLHGALLVSRACRDTHPLIDATIELESILTDAAAAARHSGGHHANTH